MAEKVAPLFKNPRQALGFLKWLRPKMHELWDADFVLENGAKTIARFGPLFRERSSQISEVDIKEFLSFAGNHHWTGLDRQRSNLLSNMLALRKGVGLLVNERLRLKERYDEAEGLVRGFRHGTMTPILFLAYPNKYGVWNKKSQFAMERLGLWFTPARTSDGEKYEVINQYILQSLRAFNEALTRAGEEPVDLWTIDYYWHGVWELNEQGELESLAQQWEQAVR